MIRSARAAFRERQGRRRRFPVRHHRSRFAVGLLDRAIAFAVLRFNGRIDKHYQPGYTIHPKNKIEQ
jgi:hypothetical protein